MTAPVATVSVTPGAIQHRQVTGKLPLSNIQSPVLPSLSSTSGVIPLHSFTGGKGIINPNPIVAQLGQGTVQVGTPSTSTMHYSSPNAQAHQSVFSQSISSPTGVNVSPGAKVIQLPQTPVLGSLQMQPGSASHSNVPVRMPMVLVDKPWITACQISTGDLLSIVTKAIPQCNPATHPNIVSRNVRKHSESTTYSSSITDGNERACVILTSNIAPFR